MIRDIVTTRTAQVQRSQPGKQNHHLELDCRRQAEGAEGAGPPADRPDRVAAVDRD